VNLLEPVPIRPTLIVTENKQMELTTATDEDSPMIETKDGEVIKLKRSQLPLMNQV
jgi:hypothetical protein